MFCPSCGAEIADDAVFCTSCGAPLSEPEAAGTAEAAVAANPVVASATARPSSAAANEPKNKKPLIIGIVVAVVAICLIIAGIVWFNVDQAAKARRAPHSVTVSITAEGYTDADTLIPIQATGTDLDGKSVNELFFVDASGRGVSLPKGSYTLSVPASPLTADGVLYQDVTTEYPLVVPEDTEDGAAVDAVSQVNVGMKKSTALDQSQAMIDRATEYAEKDESQAEKAAELSAKAQQVHDEAVAQKQHEEEVAQARQNPAMLNAVGGPVTLKGKLVRENLTTEDTGMGWASVNYKLQFDSPVTITYSGPSSGMQQTNTFNSIQVAAKEIYIATNPNANSMVASESIPELQRYVGQYVAVTGDIFDNGNMHTVGHARFTNYTIAALPS